MNETLKREFQQMIEDMESLDELDDFAENTLSDAAQEELADELTAKRDELRDTDASLAGATIGEVIDLIDSRKDLQEAVRERYTDDAEEDGDSEKEKSSAEKDKSSAEKEKTSGEKEKSSAEKEKSSGDEQEDAEDDDASSGDEDDAEGEEADEDEEDEDEEDGDEDEEEQEEEQEDAALDDLPITDSEYDADAAAERLHKHDSQVSDNLFVAEDEDGNLEVPVGDVEDGELVLNASAISTAEPRLEETDLSDAARERASDNLETLSELADASEEENKVRDHLLRTADRLGIEDAEEASTAQLAAMIEDRESERGEQTDEPKQQRPTTRGLLRAMRR